MRVLVTGGYGLIGAAVVARLLREGHEVVATGRNVVEAARRHPGGRWVVADFHGLTTPEDFAPLIAGTDAVVNCVGAFQEGPRDNLRRIHLDAPAALFAACERSGPRRVIHVSAVGAGPDGPTEFSRTKGEAEADLKRRDLEWIILRPGIVLAHAVYGGTALLRGLAGVPIVTPMIAPDCPVQIVGIDDVAETVVRLVRPDAPAKLSLDLMHPRTMTLGDIVRAYRGWLGLPPQPMMALPSWTRSGVSALADALGRLGWRSPARSTAFAELTNGMRGDPAAWIRATGISPVDLAQILAAHPATVQDRWFARLYPLKPIAVAMLALFWIVTGLVSLGPGWSEGLALVRSWPEPLPALAVAGGALLDIALGSALLVRRMARLALLAMLAVSFVYLVTATVATPWLWADPLGCLVKIFPVMLATLFTLAVLDER